jgi:phosphatidylglycerol:prolipoprotein diacylglycerol transferase
MIPYPHIDPVIVRIGPIALRWYGMMYLFGFGASYLLVRRRLRSSSGLTGLRVPPDDFLGSLYTYLVVGLMLGARLGYVLFYDLGVYIRHPLDILEVWKGGMSFHGGLIGSITASVLCCRKYGTDFWEVADLVIATAPLGLGFGRLGNFINGELFGRVTDVPWAMVFPQGGPLPRHPSQLYEFLLEGVLLFIVLWQLQKRLATPGVLTAWFLVLYGLFRSFVELFRQPDPQLGFLFGKVTMGQVLSSVMVAAGIVLMVVRKARARRQHPPTRTARRQQSS